MQLTVEDALNISRSPKKIRIIPESQLAGYETEINMMRPGELHDKFMAMISANLIRPGIHRYVEKVVKASDASMTSVDGERTILSPSGAIMDEVLDKLMLHDTVTVAVKMNTISCIAFLSNDTPGLYHDVLGYTYSLSKDKFSIFAGKATAFGHLVMIPSEDFVFTGESSRPLKVFDQFAGYLLRFRSESKRMEDEIEILQSDELNRQEVLSFFSRMHYISACVKNKDFGGMPQVFTDNVLKDAHYLLFNTSYDYVVDKQEQNLTKFRLLSAFLEATRNNSNNLLEYPPTLLAAFRFFNERIDQAIERKKPEHYL